MYRDMIQQDTAIFMAQCLREYVRQYIDGHDTCLASIKEIQSKNDAIMESELLLETIVVENGGEYIIFEYMQMIENTPDLILEAQSIEIFQSMIRKVVFSEFDFVKVWLPKFFYQIPKSFNEGKILQEDFLGELLRNFNCNMMLIFVNVCSSMFEEVKALKLLQLITLIIENNANREISETIANILFKNLRQQSTFLSDIKKELFDDPSECLLKFLKYCINSDPKFVTTYFIEPIPPIVPTIQNVTVLRDLIFDLGVSDNNLSISHMFNRSETWFAIKADGLFPVLLHLKERINMDSCILHLIDDIILSIIEFTQGKIDSLWDKDLELMLPKRLGNSLEDNSNLEYINSIYSTMKITAIMNDCSYKV